MNSKSFTKTIGIKLVKTVRKYPCLWDYSSPEYDEKESNVAWKAVANEMSSSVSKCYKRWVGIKYRYIRQGREKNRKKLKKANYLAKHLGFLAPQVRIINMNQSDDEEFTAMSTESKETDKESNESSSEDEDVDVEATNMSAPLSRINEDQYESVVDDMERSVPKKSMHELNIVIQKDNKPSTEPIINLKRERNDTADDDSGIFVQCSIRKKDRTAPVVDGKQSFLNSLFPYLQEMTGKQNRRFRQKVIAVIDEILDDAVIL